MMFPVTASNNLTDRAVVNAKGFCDGALCHTAGEALLDKGDGVITQNRCANSLASGMALFLAHIIEIVSMRALRQMFRAHATRIVTRMHDDQVGINGAMVKLIGKAVDRYTLPIYLNLAVTSKKGALPFPTMGRFLNVVPKPFFSRSAIGEIAARHRAKLALIYGQFIRFGMKGNATLFTSCIADRFRSSHGVVLQERIALWLGSFRRWNACASRPYSSINTLSNKEFLCFA